MYTEGYGDDWAGPCTCGASNSTPPSGVSGDGTMTRHIPAIVIAALMLLCAWTYYRAYEAEELAWRATCETVRWQTRCGAAESELARHKP